MKNKCILFLLIILLPFFTVIGFSSWIITGEKTEKVGENPLTSNNAKVAYLYSDKTKFYTRIEKAIEVANNSLNSEVVVVIPGSNPTIQKDITINSNVTLVIPYSWDSSSGEYTYNGRQNGSPGDSDELYLDDVGAYFSDSEKYEDKYLMNTVTIKENVSIILNGGNIYIGGITGHEGQYLAGHTSGQYSQIVMNPNSNITIVNGGIIESLGYIKEDYLTNPVSSEGNGSFIDVKNGTLRLPFVVYDFNGGTNTVGTYVGKNGPISPFSEFDLPNIHPKIKCYYTSTIIGLASLFTDAKTIASITIPQKHSNTDVKMIGSSSSVINLGEDAVLETKYVPYSAKYMDKDPAYGKTYLKFKKGTASIGSMSMVVSVPLVGEQSISTANVYFPISYKYDIHFIEGTYTFGYDTKILPGCNLFIEEKATMNITKNVIAYSDGNFDSGDTIKRYPQKDPVSFTCCGTLNISGGFGGFIKTNYGDKGKIVITTSTLSLNSNEGVGTMNSFSSAWDKIKLGTYVATKQYDKIFTFNIKSTETEPARGLIYNTSTNTSKEENFSSSSTYVSYNGAWKKI